MADGGEVLRDLLDNAVSAVTVEAQLIEHKQLPLLTDEHVILENNLSRKGIWSTDAARSAHQQVFTLETDDIVGHLIMESGLGRLSTAEMEMVSWIFAQWQRKESPEDPWVHTSIKALADAFGVKWGGSRSAFIKQSLERLDRVRFTAKVWSASKKMLITEHFGIFDHVQITERAEGFTTCWTPEAGNAPVQIKLGHFMHEQLRRGQFHRYAWQVLRGRLRSPLSKRLYVLLDGQRGSETSEGWLYERRIDERFMASLGVRDSNPRRLRIKLREACAELLEADPTYTELSVRETSEGWVLRRLKATQGHSRK